MRKKPRKSQNDIICLTKRQKKFAEYIVAGLPAQAAYLSARYSPGAVTDKPYKLLAKPDIKEYIRSLIDPHLPAIVRNDIALARLKIHKGEGLEIPPSLIENAKQRLYDRSSLGPVVKKVQDDKPQNTEITLVDLSPYKRCKTVTDDPEGIKE